MDVEVSEVRSPLGALRVGVHDERVVLAQFAEHWEVAAGRLARSAGEHSWHESSGLGACSRSVGESFDAYFEGEVTALDALKVELHGTAFQQLVWRALRAVPAGETSSYGDIAAAIGNPRAVRAVGTANGANPVVLAVPCHRIVRSGGALGGYGGGLDRKAWLLEHEGAGTTGETGPGPFSDGPSDMLGR